MHQWQCVDWSEWGEMPWQGRGNQFLVTSTMRWLMTLDKWHHDTWYMRAVSVFHYPLIYRLEIELNTFINTWTFNILQRMSFPRRFSCKHVQLTIVSVIIINPISQNAFQRPGNLLDAYQVLIEVYWLATLCSTCTAGISAVTLT